MKNKLPALILSVTFAAAAFAQTPADPFDNAPPESPPIAEAPAAPEPMPDVAPAPSPESEPVAAPDSVPDVAPETAPTDDIVVRAAERPGAGPEKGDAGSDATKQMAPESEVVPLIVIDEVPLTDAIRNLARQSRLNFQFDPRITHTADNTPTNQPLVSIRFENVTAQEALHAVLENYNLKLEQDPRSRIARITVKDPAAPEPLVARIVQLRYSDPTNLVILVKSTLSIRSQVVADPRTSQLLITTTEKEMGPVLELIETLDSPTKQVLIEAHLFESRRAPETIKGIDWSGTFEGQAFSFGNNLGTAEGAPGANNVLVGSAPPGKLLVDTARGFNPATAFLDANGVSAVLNFLNRDTETEVVATPRAVTLDNRTATLSITRAFPVFNVTPGSANSPAGAQVTYTNLGTILQVTPRIAADDNISLHVVPEVSNIDSVDQQILNGQPNTANIYAIRRIEANVMVPSGNTLVMGGLINDRRTKQYVKVPILGDIPGLGALFRQQRKLRDKSNLLIFITPTIVEMEDFHIASSGVEFLKTRVPEIEDNVESDLDSAKPHDWTKPVY